MTNPLPKSHAEDLVPAPIVAREFGVTRRTLSRWLIDPGFKFPKPAEINRRLYFRRSELEAYKESLIRKANVVMEVA